MRNHRKALAAAVVAVAGAVGAPAAHGALILNYQFEQIDGATPGGTPPITDANDTQTTPDATGNYVSDNTTNVNYLRGPGNVPGTDYPTLGVGPVQNATVKSANPNGYLSLPATAISTSAPGVLINDSAMASATAVSLDQKFTNITIAGWVRSETIHATSPRLIAAKSGTGSNRGFQISSPGSDLLANNAQSFSGGDELIIDIFQEVSGGNANPQASYVVENVLPQNVWTHFAFTFDGATGTAKVYINGVDTAFINDPVATATDTTPDAANLANSANFGIGTRPGLSGGTIGFGGGIDDFRIYNETLNQAGVSALLTPVPEPTTLSLLGLGAIGLMKRRRRA